MSPVAVEASRMDAGPIVDLFTVSYVDDSGMEREERYTAGPGASAAVMYGGDEYKPLPIALEGAGFGTSGASVRPTLRVSLLDRTATPAAWHGAKIERVRTLGRCLDGAPEADSSRHWPRESWIVDRLSSRTRECSTSAVATLGPVRVRIRSPVTSRRDRRRMR